MKILNLLCLISISFLSSCGESEVEKAAKRENDSAKAVEKVFRKVTPDGDSRGF